MDLVSLVYVVELKAWCWGVAFAKTRGSEPNNIHVLLSGRCLEVASRKRPFYLAAMYVREAVRLGVAVGMSGGTSLQHYISEALLHGGFTLPS